MIPLRDENPTQSPALVTVTIITLCVAVFLWQLSLGAGAQQQVAFALGFVPAHLFGGGPPAGSLAVPAGATLFTSMFLHGGLLHLGGNMLFLWVFGNNVEEAMGHGRFILFYLLCGTAAALAQGAADPASAMPMIGASGAISGVLGAYLLLYPRARVLVVIPLGFYFPLVWLPAVAVLGLWFLLQLVSSWAAPAEAGVAFLAHVGGFVAGVALVPLFRRAGVPLSRR
jgi:membrane associated rhomboid family serine protease